ncbi:MAG TPA: hypothetical protein VJR89_09630 [Polyangiales bacterium]|nr:hypothetical protein [Polyangiales bacterium]
MLAWVLVGCAPVRGPKGQDDAVEAAGDQDAFAPPVASMPADAASVRDDPSAAILTVSSVDKAVFPYVYGYPIYPDGAASRGITRLRLDNQQGAEQSDWDDDSGVKLASEELPQLGCRFDGVRESPIQFVPISLTCELPAPKALGGARRPVVGEVSSAAKAEQLLAEPSIQQAFLGEFHLTSDDFATGSGTGYFNTTHGQLAFVFARKRLVRFIYYFDPGVKGWRNQELWMTP